MRCERLRSVVVWEGTQEKRICGFVYTITASIVVLLVVVVVFALALFAPSLHGVFVMSFSAVTHGVSGVPLPQLGIPSMKFILIDEYSPAEYVSFCLMT